MTSGAALAGRSAGRHYDKGAESNNLVNGLLSLQFYAYGIAILDICVIFIKRAVPGLRLFWREHCQT